MTSFKVASWLGWGAPIWAGTYNYLHSGKLYKCFLGVLASCFCRFIRTFSPFLASKIQQRQVVASTEYQDSTYPISTQYIGAVCPAMSFACNFSGSELQLRPLHGRQGTHIFGQTDSVGLHTGELVGEGPVPTMLVGEILVPLFFLVDFFQCCFCCGKTFLIVLFEA